MQNQKYFNAYSGYLPEARREIFSAHHMTFSPPIEGSVECGILIALQVCLL